MVELLGLGALFVFGLAVRGASLSNLVPSPDELTYASRAVYILSYHWAWPKFAMWDQPPLFEYLLAVVTLLFGATLESLRWVSVTFGSLAIVAGYYLAKSLYGRGAGWLAAATIAVNPFQILYSKQIYIESMVSTLILFAILLFWEGVIKRRDMKVTALGGVVFGLALDSKYITLVMAVALVVFLVLYKGRLASGFPLRHVIVYFAIGLAMFLPVILDLSLNNVNPFYFDLIGRFQLLASGKSGGGVSRALAGGGLGSVVVLGFRNFIQTFFRFSPTDPVAAYPGTAIDIPVWIVVAILVFAFFVGAFFVKRTPREGMLLILFVAFLGFAFTYPGKRTYFTLYPMLIFIVMLAGLAQICAVRVRRRERFDARTLLAACVVGLTISGIAINAFGVPATQVVGFGDWDDLTPIANYVSLNHGPNSYVAINLALVGFYLATQNVNVSIAWMVQHQEYYSESVSDQALQSIQEGQYPDYRVMSLSVVEIMRPQFVVIPAGYYNVTPATFQQYMTDNYFQPLGTTHVLLFQIRNPAGRG